MQLSSTENPLLPCNAEKEDLLFKDIVADIVEEQEAIKKFISSQHYVLPKWVLGKYTFETLYVKSTSFNIHVAPSPPLA